MNGNSNYGQEVVGFFLLTFFEKILAIILEGYLGHGIKWDAPSSFGLWAWPLEASHYAHLKDPIPIVCGLFSAHLFGLSKNFGYSSPRPLNLDGHSVKQPLNNIG